MVTEKDCVAEKGCVPLLFNPDPTIAVLIDPSSQTHNNNSNLYDDTFSLNNMFFIVIRTLPVFV